MPQILQNNSPWINIMKSLGIGREVNCSTPHKYTRGMHKVIASREQGSEVNEPLIETNEGAAKVYKLLVGAPH